MKKRSDLVENHARYDIHCLWLTKNAAIRKSVLATLGPPKLKPPPPNAIGSQ